MAWIIVVIAGVLETVWALGLKYSDGFSRLWPSVFTLACMGLSFYLLSLAMKTLEVGSAYAVWTGIGAVGAAIGGMILFHEPRDLPRILCIMLIVAGIVGLRVFAKTVPSTP